MSFTLQAKLILASSLRKFWVCSHPVCRAAPGRRSAETSDGAVARSVGELPRPDRRGVVVAGEDGAVARAEGRGAGAPARARRRDGGTRGGVAGRADRDAGGEPRVRRHPAAVRHLTSDIRNHSHNQVAVRPTEPYTHPALAGALGDGAVGGAGGCGGARAGCDGAPSGSSSSSNSGGGARAGQDAGVAEADGAGVMRRTRGKRGGGLARAAGNNGIVRSRSENAEFALATDAQLSRRTAQMPNGFGDERR